MYYLPIALIIFANIFYQISAKETPGDINSMFMILSVYIVAGIVAFVAFLVQPGIGFSSIPEQIKMLRWPTITYGLSVITLELGFIMMYRVGWNTSVGATVANIGLAVAMVIVGHFVYHEAISITQLLGIACCIFGIVLITK